MLDLRKILRLSTAVYVLLAAAAFAFMSRASHQITLGYLTNDTLAADTGTVFAPAARVLYDLEIRWAVIALLVFSLALPILYLTRMERRYADALRGRVLPWRWIDLAVSSALMMEVIALLSGVQDMMTLKLIGGMMAITCALGWIAERQNNDTDRPVWSAYVTSLFSGLLPWLMGAVYAVATPFYGLVRAPWYVYALYAAGLAGFGLLALNQLSQHRRLGSYKDYFSVERRYLVINLLTKLAFAGILIVGLKK